jgi:N-ethylmaleimide reductase
LRRCPPRALTRDEIKQTIDDYGRAAANTSTAGFNGIQIHAANGYLIDQFLQSRTNRRTDEYGGAVETRIRFLSEVARAVTAEWSQSSVRQHSMSLWEWPGMS